MGTSQQFLTLRRAREEQPLFGGLVEDEEVAFVVRGGIAGIVVDERDT
jgi:hypothetical protein